MEFRPCIDIHNGKVKQIVGGSLTDQNDHATENFVSGEDASFYAHLYKNVANTIQQQAKKECKVICVFTDVINSNENSVRITSKQSVNILYEYYTQNAEQIIPIVKKINKKVGFNFGDTSFSWLINKAASQKSPYYFNYIIRGASDYIKTKMEDYKKDEFLDLLAVIAIY